MLPWTLALLACGSASDSGGPGDAGVGDAGADGGTADGGAEAPELLPPTGDRVLLYTGHGGIPPQGSGKASFLDLQARWEAQGYSTHARDALPEDLGIYRLMVLVAPGAGAAIPFSDDEVARIEASRAQGNRVLILGDLAMCGSAEVDALLQALGTRLAFTGEGADSNRVVTGEVQVQVQVTAGVGSLELRDPCWVQSGTGVELVTEPDGQGLLVAELPADGGEVMVLGDLELLDDRALAEADNAVLADNLARVKP